ncbi:MAG: hypothetical protein LIP23_05600 [Planctomycetes bacterium]|nr:hypothetical protein [Planctomycetota bacterium]
MASKDIENNPAAALLAKKDAGPGPHPLHPLDHLAFAIAIDAGNGVDESLAAIAALRREYVDWNEVRVARTQELARTLSQLVDAERCALRIKEEYNAFFEKKGELSFEFLAVGKPAETRRMLGQQLPHLGKGAVSLLLYEFCAGAALPISDDGLKQARKDGVIGRSADRAALSRVLADSLSLADAARLLQYWELEGHGGPYYEMPKRDPNAGKKKKTSGKGKKKA